MNRREFWTRFVGGFAAIIGMRCRPSTPQLMFRSDAAAIVTAGLPTRVDVLYGVGRLNEWYMDPNIPVHTVGTFKD